ncbi:MAG: SRPBCC family protein [Acidimicrobiales bacterium]
MFDLIGRLYSPVVAQGVVSVPPDAVYDAITDPTTYTEWLVGAHDVRQVDSDFPAPGAEFDHSVGLGGPLTVGDSTETIEAVPDSRLSLLVHIRPFHARVDFELHLRADGGTDVRFSEVPVGAFRAITPALRPMLFARNQSSLDRLRTYLEPDDT